MVFSMCIDATSFNLQLKDANEKVSSKERPLISVEYLKTQYGCIDGDPDVLIHLNNFSGTLLIVRHDNNDKNFNQNTDTPRSEHDPCNENIEKRISFDSYVTFGSPSKDEEIEANELEETIGIENEVNTPVIETESESPKHSVFFERDSDGVEKTLVRDSMTASVQSDYNIPTKVLRHAFERANRLHLHCKSNKMNVQMVEALLKSQPSLASQRDSNGRLPLHVLVRNEALICGSQKNSVRSFVLSLLKIYPAAAYAIDNEGLIPFTGAIYDWIYNINNISKTSLVPRGNFLKSFTNIWDPNNNTNILVPSTLVEVTEIIKWSFEMLSMILERFEKYDKLKRNSIVANQLGGTTASEFIIGKFASIPSLLKTVLLIKGNDLKFQVLELPIFQRILLKKSTVGPWLVTMLGSKGKDASRAIDYFDILSSVTSESALALQTRARMADRLIFHQMQEDMVKHLADITGIIPSLFLLNEQEKLRASSKLFVQRILHLCVSNPTMIGWLILDFNFNTLMLVAYPLHIELAVKKIDDSLNHHESNLSLLLLWICGYCFLRDNLAILVMAKSYKFLFKRYFLFTEIIKNLAMFFTFITTIMPLIGNFRQIYPLTVTLLWTRLFISYIELNVNFATIILSVGRIIRGISAFLIFLLCFTAMFSEIMNMHYIVNMSTLCSGVNPEEETDFDADFCSLNFFRQFIRIYGLIAGDMTIDPYRITGTHSLVYIFFVMFGSIILLNILIAVIIDIYQNSCSQRQALLAKERLFLLAKHVSLHTFFDHIMSESYKYHNYVSFLAKSVFISIVILFQVSMVLFMRKIMHLKEFLSLHVLIILVLTVYMFCTNITLLFLLGKIFDWEVIENWFDPSKENTNFIMRALMRGTVKVMNALLGFKKDFWAETEEKDSLVRTIGAMLKKSERRIISKLSLTQSDNFTDLRADECEKLSIRKSTSEKNLFV